MYRYTENKHLESFMNQGVIRVGTLHDFRRNEHGKGIADTEEGKKIVSHYIEDRTITEDDMIAPSNKDSRAMKSFGLITLSGGSTITMRDVHTAKKIEHPDCYILCSSHVASKETMAEFGGADSCIQIVDVAGFYRCLTESLTKKNGGELDWFGHHNVLYRDRNEKWNGENWGDSPAVIKSKDFAKQFETRGIWAAKNLQPIKPEFVQDARLPRFCKVISL